MRWLTSRSVNSRASRTSCGDSRSALFSAKIAVGTCARTSTTRASSSPEIGGSAPRTTSAASMCGTKARVASVLPANVDPMPGVSTRHKPWASSGAGRQISTAATPRAFSWLCSSATNSGTSSIEIGSLGPAAWNTVARRSAPCLRIVTAEVTGVTPTGSTRSPTRALSTLDFPRLNWPTHATKKRPAETRSTRLVASPATSGNSASRAIPAMASRSFTAAHRRADTARRSRSRRSSSRSIDRSSAWPSRQSRSARIASVVAAHCKRMSPSTSSAQRRRTAP